jgi:hypothetical protein
MAVLPILRNTSHENFWVLSLWPISKNILKLLLPLLPFKEIWCFYNCCNLKLQFGLIFEILSFNFAVKLAKFLNNSMFFKSPLSQHPLIGKFQNWVEMKVNYPTNKRNTRMDFSDSFHNIKNFIQVDHLENIMKTAPFFLLITPENTPMVWKIFQLANMYANRCQIIVLKFQLSRTFTRFTI